MGWNDVVALCQRRVEDCPPHRMFSDHKIAEAFEAYYVARNAYQKDLCNTPLMNAWRHTMFEGPKEDGANMKLTEALLDHARRRKFRHGKNSLMNAVKKGNVEYMEFLLRFTLEDFKIHDASEVTCSNNNELAHMNINEQDVRGRTALMHCMHYAKRLGELNAKDPIQIEKVKQMALLLLAEQHHDEKIDIDGPLRNEHGQTALDIAKSIKYRKLRKVLVNTLIERL